MTIRASHRLWFRIPLETLNAKFADPAYYAAKHLTVGAWDVVPQPLAAASGNAALQGCYTMKVQARVPLPESLQKVLGGTLSVRQTDRWDAAAQSGTIDIDVKGLPIRASATTRLEAAGDEMYMVSDWTVKCAIPLLGGMVERLGSHDIETRQFLECAAVG